jgi:hypothetical protein
MVRYSNLGPRTDFTKFEAHYVLFFLVPLVMIFFEGKISKPLDLVDEYINTIEDIKKDIVKHRLSPGI